MREGGGATVGGEAPPAASARLGVLVWDLPTRLFHWLVVALVAISVYTGNVGGLREMEWHTLSGYAILTLVLFRLAWGAVGGRNARFRNFLRGPRAVAAYARGLAGARYRPSLGHNPLGGWSVLAMLASLALQATTGLFANDDILTEGPLAKYVSEATSDRLSAVHAWNATILYVLIGVHVAAVLLYLVVKRENLTGAMISGRKRAGSALRQDTGAEGNALLAAALLAAAAAAVWALVTY
jgi:cytochrome b